MTFGEETARTAAAPDNPAMPGTASDRDERKSDCEAMVMAVLEPALPTDSTGCLSAANIWHLAQELVRDVFEPKGLLRDRARKEPARLAEMIGVATLPSIMQGRRHDVARMLIEILEFAKFIGFEPEAATDDWPRLRARARRGMLVA